MSDVLDLSSDDPDSYPPIQILMLRAFRSIGPIAKKDTGTGVNYSFRGVDTVTNAVSPILRDLGILPTPEVLDERIDNYVTKNGAAMNRAIVRVRWTFTGPRGDSMTATVSGESADTSDKSVTQAQSVAQRVTLLAVFLIPTDAPDPDEQHEDRAVPDPWHEIGWENEAEHDDAVAEVVAKALLLGEDQQLEVKGFLKGNNWGRPYERTWVDQWMGKVEALTPDYDPDEEPF